MGILGEIIGRLFARAPRRHTTAYGALYASIVARLGGVTVPGVKIGSTADYPRIEVHSILENERTDKEGNVRRLSLTVESMSKSSLGECAAMNDQAMALLTGAALDPGPGWDCFGVVPVLLQDMTETADTQAIVYRLIQQYDIWLTRVKV